MANEDKSARYHRLRRRASVFATLSSGLLLIVLLFSGAAVALRVLTDEVTDDTFVLSASLYAVLLVMMSEVLALPLAYYQGMTLERRYGLATQTTAGWLLDRCKTVAVALVLAVSTPAASRRLPASSSTSSKEQSRKTSQLWTAPPHPWTCSPWRRRSSSTGARA